MDIPVAVVGHHAIAPGRADRNARGSMLALRANQETGRSGAGRRRTH